MARPSPRQVFDNPQSALEFLTQSSDTEFEGQHFERKEVGSFRKPSSPKTILKNARELIKKTVSAFANSNNEGGLLVLGISSSGEIIGIDHLDETQRNSITNLDDLLHNHAAEINFYECQDENGNNKMLCLIYSAYVPNAICETPEANPRAWIRSGSQSILMTQTVRDQVRRSKDILNFESWPLCPFSSDDLDSEVIKNFRRVFHPNSTQNFTDERLLCEAGAIVKKNSDLFFTLPGLLFFSSNPQRVLSHAYLRLMKFLVPNDQHLNRGTPSFDKDFRGPITKQIRAARTFLHESSFFNRFQHRKANGGFEEQPELPPIAVEEAIVNAVAHRDYYTKNPIECEYYTDGFVVKNPGRIIQRNFDLPESFSLKTTTLDSLPRNRKLVEWLRWMRDPNGKAFLQAISEGTKRMTREMVALDLPAPSFKLSQNETILLLENNSEERKTAFLDSIRVPKTAFINLYPLVITKRGGKATSDEIHLRLKEISKAMCDSLSAHGWFIDRFSFSRIVAHRMGVEYSSTPAVHRIVRFYPAYCMQIHELFGRTYISIDYTCQILSVLKANEALQYLSTEDLIGRRCVAQLESWQKGRIASIDSEWIKVHFFDTEEERQVQVNQVIPNLSLAQINMILKSKSISFNFHGTIKKCSLASETAAARKRAEKIQLTAEDLTKNILPVTFGNFEARMQTKAVALSEFEPTSNDTFHIELLNEPAVEFRDHHKLPDIREGITKFGSFDITQHKIELVPICLVNKRKEMDSLIQRLKAGKYKYRGAERTFATRFIYSTIVTVNSPEELHKEVERLLSEHPEWLGNTKLNRLFLVHTPKADYSIDDETSPYYVVKRRLLEAGIPCQMVDTDTIQNPDWKDLNLSLNIIAKCGITPWVLPENIPDADFFVGLSYTQSRKGQKILGFANVFNSYGKWEFYTGNTSTFDARKRSEHLATLSLSVLKRLKREQTLPTQLSLVFHHSVRISKDDYSAILAAVRTISPDASISFVWINPHNNFRLFDSKVDTDGSLQRGDYVTISRRRLLLSTTGYNTYRKAIGTPRPIEISVNYYPTSTTTPAIYDTRTLALQVLNLTKLNWASTDSFTAEPITVKYARNIAYLTAAFLRQSEPFQLHQVLERTPWFL
jgi:predicted HTH transcriptional regulator